ncbi:hypothetical protein V8B55DRAFT_1441781 [Mucor lusitanicus]|uniref:Uncharacterized protein n=1 Tax=Mucor lusitanicus CBS 277.49 TaxID=747725 RepID=A0A168GZB1_MUCCL|nr:hypothetical protein MUCCIDRAFT_115711 [Mucor lusitanicus CBS 277.49]
MLTENDVTPKMSKLFADIDKLIDKYVFDVAEYPLETTTQRFVGWHVCQDFSMTFCKSFAPPSQPREEHDRYVAEQKRTEQSIEKYKNMQGYLSEKFDVVKKENPTYHQWYFMYFVSLIRTYLLDLDETKAIR